MTRLANIGSSGLSVVLCLLSLAESGRPAWVHSLGSRSWTDSDGQLTTDKGRVELHRPHVIELGSRREALSVLGDRGGLTGHRGVIGMAVVDKTSIGHTVEQAIVAPNLKLAPTHMRHLENILEASNPAAQHSEARGFRCLVTSFVERLQTETDSEKGLARR